jgi:hypothetical protein
MKTWSTTVGILVVVVTTSSSSTFADDYSVNRSWNDGANTASLVGTVSLPQGSYTITNGTPNPFTAVNLTLTANAVSYALDQANTSLVFGTGEFHISATASTLTFDTANANGSNPADLRFTSSVSSDRYAIGYDGNPGFQLASTSTASVEASQSFPTVFGVAVPEPTLAAPILLTLLAAHTGRRRRR